MYFWTFAGTYNNDRHTGNSVFIPWPRCTRFACEALRLGRGQSLADVAFGPCSASPRTARSFRLSVGEERFAFMRDARCKQLRISGIVNAEVGKQRLVMLAESRRARPY